MATITDTILIDGVTLIDVEGQQFDWNGQDYLDSIDIYSDMGGGPYPVTVTLDGGAWGVGLFRIGGPDISTVTLTDTTGGGDDGVGFDEITLEAMTSTNLIFTQASFDRLEIWGASEDTVVLGAGYYQWIDLGEGNDSITTGEGGADFIMTAEGADTVTIGGTGDIAFISTGDDDDTVNAVSGYAEYINTNDGNDTVNITDTGIGSLMTGDGDDTVTFLNGAMGGANLIDLGDGANELVIDGAGEDFGIASVTAGEGNDTVEASGHEWGYIISMNLNEGDNSIVTGISIDSLLTEDGNDTLTIQAGALINYASLGGGNDTVTVDSGAIIDVLDISEGVNEVTVNGNANVIKGYNGINTINIGDGTSLGFIQLSADDSTYTNEVNIGENAYVDAISLGASDDTVTIGANSWVESLGVTRGTNVITVKGGGGATSVRGSNGSTTLTIEAGGYIDSVNLYSNQSYVDGGGLGSTVNAVGYASSIFFGRAIDTLNIGAEGIGFADMGRGNDIINIGEASEAEWSSLVSGGEGADTVSFAAFTSGVEISLATSAYNETDHGMFALIGIERLIGTSLADTLTGARSSASELLGGAGNDTYYITSSATIVNEQVGGGGAADTVRSANVSITLSDASKFKGQVENATLDGASSLNLTGNSLANKLTGNSNRNVIDGKGGDDTLIGGAGKDDFQFSSTLSAATNVDEINSYNVADDRIVLDNAVFTALPGGALAASAFQANNSGNATTANARIIYDINDGQLYYDKDGNGSASAVLFAELNANLAMTRSEFFVI